MCTLQDDFEDESESDGEEDEDGEEPDEDVIEEEVEEVEEEEIAEVIRLMQPIAVASSARGTSSIAAATAVPLVRPSSRSGSASSSQSTGGVNGGGVAQSPLSPAARHVRRTVTTPTALKKRLSVASAHEPNRLIRISPTNQLQSTAQPSSKRTSRGSSSSSTVAPAMKKEDRALQPTSEKIDKWRTSAVHVLGQTAFDRAYAYLKRVRSSVTPVDETRIAGDLRAIAKGCGASEADLMQALLEVESIVFLQLK